MSKLYKELGKDTLKFRHYGEMAQWLRRWIPNPEVPCSKPLCGSEVDSDFHPSEMDQMSTRSF